MTFEEQQKNELVKAISEVAYKIEFMESLPNGERLVIEAFARVPDAIDKIRNPLEINLQQRRIHNNV